MPWTPLLFNARILFPEALKDILNCCELVSGGVEQWLLGEEGRYLPSCFPGYQACPGLVNRQLS